jgi:2-(1,2-epoxy-1,2-dihydrophenyl)acetyl-CoA isomerase
MAYQGLLLEKDAGVATITLNVPEKLNAITREVSMDIGLVADELSKDDEIRVVIVTGAGRGFCSGADVSAMASRGDSASGGHQISRYHLLQMTGWPHSDAFPHLDKPVIAAINGPCVGGGLSLALSCDVRIAADNAFFSVAQVSRALVPDFGMTYYLPLAVGLSKAMELMFTAERFTAADAREFGMVSQVVPPDELINAANELAAKIASQAPVSVSLTKRMVWRSMFDGLDRQLDLETWATRIASQTEDHRESVRAFLNKEPLPNYKGR